MNKDDVDKKLKAMGKRRKLVLKILLALSILYLAFIFVIIFLIYYVGSGYWIIEFFRASLYKFAIIGCILYSLFILIGILLHVNYSIEKKKLEESLKPKPLFYKGKRLYIFTYPPGSKGGVYSKTIIDIDDKTVINLRYQVLKPQDIWR